MRSWIGTGQNPAVWVPPRPHPHVPDGIWPADVPLNYHQCERCKIARLIRTGRWWQWPRAMGTCGTARPHWTPITASTSKVCVHQPRPQEKSKRRGVYRRERQDVLAHHFIVQNLGDRVTQSRNQSECSGPLPSDVWQWLALPQECQRQGKLSEDPWGPSRRCHPISGKKGRMWGFLTDHRS